MAALLLSVLIHSDLWPWRPLSGTFTQRNNFGYGSEQEACTSQRLVENSFSNRVRRVNFQEVSKKSCAYFLAACSFKNIKRLSQRCVQFPRFSLHELLDANMIFVCLFVCIYVFSLNASVFFRLVFSSW